MVDVRVSAKADYAVRAAVELAGAGEGWLTAEIIASQRGPDGGHRLARPAEQITVADVLRAVEGPLAAVRGEPPEALHYGGSAEPVQLVWIALRTNMRAVLEGVKLSDLAAGRLPSRVQKLAREPESWVTR
jgi:DNA-binding IscR family transcriptional regulator